MVKKCGKKYQSSTCSIELREMCVHCLKRDHLLLGWGNMIEEESCFYVFAKVSARNLLQKNLIEQWRIKMEKTEILKRRFVIRRLKLRNRKSATAGSGRRNIYGRISFDWATIYYKSWINISRPGFGAMVTNWTESGLHWCLSKHS